MCKYCEDCSVEMLARYVDSPKNSRIDKEPKFCLFCGTPLGDVKPLTVEQLREREGKPVWVQFFSKNFKGGKIESWAIVDTRFKSMEVSENSLKFCYYGTSWYCYDRKPKGEAK